MSQYPSPYPGPQPQYPGGYPYPQPGYADPLAPAKRSSILMFVLGGLIMACGLCFGAVSMVPLDQMPPETAGQFSELESQFESSFGMSFMTMLRVIAAVALIPGILLIVLGFLVRGGGLGAVITSIVVVALLVIALLIQMVGGVVQSASMAPTEAGMGICIVGIPLILSILLLVWLIQAARAAPRVAAAKAQYQAQYWQYQQQQQAYGQPPYPQQAPQAPPPPPGNDVNNRE